MSTRKILGGDYGGQNFPIAIADIDKETIIKMDEFPTKTKGKDPVEQFEWAISDISKGYDMDAAFVATAGTLDLENGVIKFSPNIPEMNMYHMGENMSNILDIDVECCGIGNDATIAIYGEYAKSGYSKRQNLIDSKNNGFAVSIQLISFMRPHLYKTL